MLGLNNYEPLRLNLLWVSEELRVRYASEVCPRDGEGNSRVLGLDPLGKGVPPNVV